MSEIFTKTKALLVLHWLMGVRVTLFSFASFGTCWLTATNKIDWSALSTYDQVQVLIGCFVVWSGTMLAFIDSSIKQLNHGSNPVATDTK